MTYLSLASVAANPHVHDRGRHPLHHANDGVGISVEKVFVVFPARLLWSFTPGFAPKLHVD